jgi:hypothetical protein
MGDYIAVMGALIQALINAHTCHWIAPRSGSSPRPWPRRPRRCTLYHPRGAGHSSGKELYTHQARESKTYRRDTKTPRLDHTLYTLIHSQGWRTLHTQSSKPMLTLYTISKHVQLIWMNTYY